MRRRLVALAVLVVLTALAAPSRAMATLYLLDLQVDVDARIAALTGTLTPPQKTDKAHLTSISRTLNRKSKTLTTDLATAVKAATLVEKYYAADRSMADELTSALDGFQNHLGQVDRGYFFAAPTSPDPYATGRKHLAKAEMALTSAASATSIVGRAKDLHVAANSMLAAEKSLPKPKFEVTPRNLVFGQVEAGSDAAPQAITVKNTGYSAIEVYVALTGSDTLGFSFVDPSTYDPISYGPFVLLPGADRQIQIGFSWETPTIERATRHVAVVAGSYSFVNNRAGAFSERRVILTAEAVKTN